MMFFINGQSCFQSLVPDVGLDPLTEILGCGEFGLNCFILTQAVPGVKSQVTQSSAECGSCNCTPPLFGKEVIKMAAPIL